MLQDCLTCLGESHIKIQHKLKKVLGYVRAMIEEKIKIEIDYKKSIDQYHEEMKRKVGEWEEERSKLKKGNE